MSTLSTIDAAVKVPGSSEGVVPYDVRGNWPRMLKLSKSRKSVLINWLTTEIDNAIEEKEEIVEDWKSWQKQYWAQPASKVKNFPFQRAANIVVPLTAIAVEAVQARLMNTIWSVEPFWSIRPRTKRWIEAAKPTEEWLQSEVEDCNSLDAYRFCSDTLMELCKLGTGIGKSGYTKIVKKSLRPNPAGGKDDPYYTVVSNGATLEYVACANFLIRAGEQDPQTAAWCGEEHAFTWGQMKGMSQSGRMIQEAVEKIRHWQESNDVQQSGSGADYEEQVEKLDKFEPKWDERFRVQEIWCSFDVDGVDGEDEEIVVDFHKASGTILSIHHNWYADLHRPYRGVQYVTVEGRFWGLGIGKQNEQFQDIITTIKRQALDNATLANMRMLAVKKQSGISPDEPIFPGKLWFLDDPSKDVRELEMSEIYQSSYANEQTIQAYSDKRTGVNETLLGLPQQGTPGTATGDLARIAEGNKRFDLVLRNIRRWLGLLGQDVLSNYQQYGDQKRHWLVKEEEGGWVERILSMPQELVRKGAIIELSATSSIVNRQVEQQQWMSLFQVISTYYERIIQLSSLFQDPKLLVSVAQRAVGATDEAMKRLLATFEVPEAERLLFLEENNGGTPPSDTGVVEAGGLAELLASVGGERLASLLSGAGGAGENGRGIPPGRLLPGRGLGTSATS